MGVTWSCNSRANVNYETIKLMEDCGLRLFLVGYGSGNQPILDRIKKGVTIEEMKRFTKGCKEIGGVIHGTQDWAIEVKSGCGDKVSGMAAFRQRYPKAKAWLVGATGIKLEEFFARPAAEWFQ